MSDGAFPTLALIALMDAAPLQPVTARITIWQDGELQVEAWHRTDGSGRLVACGDGIALDDAIDDATRRGWHLEDDTT